MPDLNEGEPVALAETDERLLWLLRRAGDEWGGLGVALTAALLTDADAVVRSLVTAGTVRAPEPGGPHTGYAYLLDDETIERLPRVKRTRTSPRPLGEVLADTVEPGAIRGGVQYETEEQRLRRQLAGVIEERDRTRDARVEAEAELARRRSEWESLAAEGRQQVERLVSAADAYLRERDEARRQLVEQGEAAEEQADALRSEVARLSGLLDKRSGGVLVLPDGVRMTAEPGPLDTDPRRPRLDHFPSDAITLTYREVRQLLALHVEAVGESVLSLVDQARAMREGETPLRLAEVLDR